jgi:UTP--glucose-1-phosphate uridylyltransferase
MASSVAARPSQRAADAPHGLQVRKAIIPLAGLGTRLLPATKVLAKGMLPLIDKPVVQYVVEEAAAAGLTDIVLISGRDHRALEAHFAPAPRLERLLAERGGMDALAELATLTGATRIGHVSQDQPRGLGDAVLRCASYVGAEPFAILFGDNVLLGPDELLTRMLAARNTYGGTILALKEVSRSEVSSRGVVAFEPTGDPAVVRITKLVEKPCAADAPSNWIMIGRCVCDPAIFQILRDTPAGHGGEIQLSDALSALAVLDAGSGGGVHGVFFHARRLDTGNRQDYVRAIVELACTRQDIAGEFLPWLRQYVRALGGSQDEARLSGAPAGRTW